MAVDPTLVPDVLSLEVDVPTVGKYANGVRAAGKDKALPSAGSGLAVQHAVPAASSCRIVALRARELNTPLRYAGRNLGRRAPFSWRRPRARLASGELGVAVQDLTPEFGPALADHEASLRDKFPRLGRHACTSSRHACPGYARSRWLLVGFSPLPPPRRFLLFRLSARARSSG